MAQGNFTETINQLEGTLNEYFGKKAPNLPQNIKEILVKIAPYLVILFVIFSIPTILTIFGLGGLSTSSTVWISLLLLIPIVILEAMAIPGLFARSIKAWRYLFWAQLISAASSLLQYNIVGAVIGVIIGFYLLFQVRSLYK